MFTSLSKDALSKLIEFSPESNFFYELSWDFAAATSNSVGENLPMINDYDICNLHQELLLCARGFGYI